MVQSGVDVDVLTKDGTSPLHYACLIGPKELVEILVNAGADINVQSVGYGGATPLHLAAQASQCQIVRLLLSAGAKVDVGDKTNRSALQIGCQIGSLPVVHALLTAQATPNWQDERGFSPLHEASKGGFVDVVRELIGWNANLKIRTSEGSVPLHLATWKGHTDVVKLLLECGADINANRNGQTALHLACKYGYRDIVQLLLEHGADSSCVDRGNRLPESCIKDSVDQTVRLAICRLVAAARLNGISFIRNLSREEADKFSANTKSHARTAVKPGHHDNRTKGFSPSNPLPNQLRSPATQNSPEGFSPDTTFSIRRSGEHISRQRVSAARSLQQRMSGGSPDAEMPNNQPVDVLSRISPERNQPRTNRHVTPNDSPSRLDTDALLMRSGQPMGADGLLLSTGDLAIHLSQQTHLITETFGELTNHTIRLEQEKSKLHQELNGTRIELEQAYSKLDKAKELEVDHLLKVAKGIELSKMITEKATVVAAAGIEEASEIRAQLDEALNSHQELSMELAEKEESIRRLVEEQSLTNARCNYYKSNLEQTQQELEDTLALNSRLTERLAALEVVSTLSEAKAMQAEKKAQKSEQYLQQYKGRMPQSPSFQLHTISEPAPTVFIPAALPESVLPTVDKSYEEQSGLQPAILKQTELKFINATGQRKADEERFNAACIKPQLKVDQQYLQSKEEQVAIATEAHMSNLQTLQATQQKLEQVEEQLSFVQKMHKDMIAERDLAQEAQEQAEEELQQSREEAERQKAELQTLRNEVQSLLKANQDTEEKLGLAHSKVEEQLSLLQRTQADVTAEQMSTQEAQKKGETELRLHQLEAEQQKAEVQNLTIQLQSIQKSNQKTEEKLELARFQVFRHALCMWKLRKLRLCFNTWHMNKQHKTKSIYFRVADAVSWLQVRRHFVRWSLVAKAISSVEAGAARLKLILLRMMNIRLFRAWLVWKRCAWQSISDDLSRSKKLHVFIHRIAPAGSRCNQKHCICPSA